MSSPPQHKPSMLFLEYLRQMDLRFRQAQIKGFPWAQCLWRPLHSQTWHFNTLPLLQYEHYQSLITRDTNTQPKTLYITVHRLENQGSNFPTLPLQHSAWGLFGSMLRRHTTEIDKLAVLAIKYYLHVKFCIFIFERQPHCSMSALA